MRILVLGGTGAMGTHLVELLAARGDAVTVTSRTHRPDTGSIRFVSGNAKDTAFIDTLLTERWDAIVDFMVYSTSKFASRADRLLGATGHYLYLSSSRVYAESDSPITEASPRLLDVTQDKAYLRTDEYALTKARQEDVLFRSKQRNWSIIRPYITYSAKRLQLGVLEKEDWLYRALQGRTLATLADIQDTQTTLTHGADVAAGMAALIGNPQAYGEAFHITTPQPILWGQVLDTYLSVLEGHMGQKPKVALQTLDEFTRWRTGRYQIVYDRLYHRHFDTRKINQFIDTSGFTSPMPGLKHALETFLHASPSSFGAINWRAEAIKDRLFKEHSRFEEIAGSANKLKYLLFRHSGLGQS